MPKRRPGLKRLTSYLTVCLTSASSLIFDSLTAAISST
jgi:hypothetical protein